MNRTKSKTSSGRTIRKSRIVSKKTTGSNSFLSVSRSSGKTTASLTGNSTNGYITFGSGRRSMRGAFAFANPPEKDIDPKLEKLRASARDLYMNTPIASGIIKRCRTMIINSGLILQARINRKFLKISDDIADEWEAEVEREFDLWSKSKNSDARRSLDFMSNQGLALFSELLSGDVFVLLLSKARPGWPYRFCIKIVEADFVSNPFGIFDTETIVSGVETDLSGEVVAYHMTDRHPGSMFPKKWVRVPAFGANSGRQNILHNFEAERPGQRRGVPMLAPVIESLKQVSRLTEAELMASVITAFLTVFIESPGITDTPLDGGIPSSDQVSDPTNNPSDQGSVELGNGSVIGLAPGEKANPVDPKRPNGAYDPFFMSIVKQIGAAIEMPFEVVILCFQSSYSASRASLLQAWQWFLSRRNKFKRSFCAPVYEEFLAEAVATGRISAPGFFTDPAIRAAWCGAEWIGKGMGQINPEVETNASIARIEGCLSTHAKEVALIDGDDFEAMLPILSREMKLKKAAGLMVEPGAPSNQAQDEPPRMPQDQNGDEITQEGIDD